ncbi:MAG TPA: TadE/TadG family type IV pilus assembly protein [Acidimicrobiales bacterium]|nr:TadE/TadG family type IV pilus assembly protein [Acidimicrobiales bacterium]
MTKHPESFRTRERGAAAVEFAIVLPLLLLLVFGIIEFGRGYEAKVQLTGSVREGARALALGRTAAQAQQAVIDAAPGLNPPLTAANISTTPCPAGGADGNATVTVTYDLPSLTPLVPGGSIGINVSGVMRCGL